MNKKGQVTIFVIIAILIVIAGILIYQFVPSVKTAFTGVETNPNIYIKDCLENDASEAILEVSTQGGSVNPEHYFLHKDEKFQYLCYTSEYYKKCVVQVPFIKEKVEQELTETLKSRVDSCFNSLKEDYDSKGYGTTLEKGPFEVRILPNRVELLMNTTLTTQKDTKVTYDSFRVPVNNNLYQLLDIAKVIVDFESELGEIETTELMSLYRNVKVEKLKQSDETTLYIITDKKTGDKFQFASRSMAFPVGYN